MLSMGDGEDKDFVVMFLVVAAADRAARE